MKGREYPDFLRDILDSAIALEEFVAGTSFEEFKNDKRTVYAAVRAFEIMGEATKHIPAATRNKYPEVPWQDMAAMRDKLIHDYLRVDVDVLWETIHRDVPTLKSDIARILHDMQSQS